jgi:hypothetical protein
MADNPRVGGCQKGRREVIERCTECQGGFQAGVGLCMDCDGEAVRKYWIKCTVEDCESAYCTSKKDNH